MKHGCVMRSPECHTKEFWLEDDPCCSVQMGSGDSFKQHCVTSNSEASVWFSGYWARRRLCRNRGLPAARNSPFSFCFLLFAVIVMLHFSHDVSAGEATFLFVWDTSFIQKKQKLFLLSFIMLISPCTCAGPSAPWMHFYNRPQFYPFEHWFAEHYPWQATRFKRTHLKIVHLFPLRL